MRIHPFSAAKLAEDLAADRVSAQDQARYLALSFVAWGVAYYLSIIPTSITQGPFYWWLWGIEFFFVILVNVTGVMFCLRKCRVEPKKNFLVFFSCLFLPTSLSTIVIVWGAFHLLWAVLWALPGRFSLFPWLASAEAYDVIRFFAYMATLLVIYVRIGAHMERISDLRQSSNKQA